MIGGIDSLLIDFCVLGNLLTQPNTDFQFDG
jgi:hypothetical protein